MKLTLLILIIIITGLISCGQAHKSTPILEPKDLETSNTADPTEIQKSITTTNTKYIDTKYVYTDSDGKQIIVENSLPKGGLKYSAPDGKEYIYAVHWTRITNTLDNPLELKIGFPESSYELPSSPGRFFKLFIPSDTMISKKESLFNYGLDLEKYLDSNLHEPARLNRTINPNNSSGFYIVSLFNKGVDGKLRTGLSIHERNIFYRINDKEIHCGKISFMTLKLKK